MKLLTLIALLIPSHLLAQQSSQNNLINWFAGADLVAASGSGDADLKSEFYVREFEISANSQIDQTFEGVLTLSYHNEIENEDEHFEIHEAFLISNKIFNNTVFKVGKFFLGFGRLNRFHRHDWIFTDAPLIQKAFFGNEGAKDTGVEFKFNMPSLTSSLTVGVTGGLEFKHGAHNHEEEEEEHTHSESGKAPTAYLRWAYFHEFTTQHGFELALNVVSRRDEENIGYQYAGVDFIYKDRAGKVVKNLVQSEIWANQETHSEDGEDEEFNNIGAYLYYERGLDQHHALGLRVDYYKPDAHAHEHAEEEGHEHSIDGIAVHKEYRAAGLSYIYTNSEFTRFRLTAEYLDGIEVDEEETSAVRAFAQIVFSIGAHPAHVY